MADQREGTAQQRQPLCDQWREFERALPGHRADADRVAIGDDVVEPGNAVQVYEGGRRDQAEIHHRHEALPAGQQPRLAVVVPQQRQRLVERGWGAVFEFRRLHGV